MMDKNKIIEFREYFSEELEVLETQMKESEEVYKLLWDEVKDLLAKSAVPQRGNSKYKADMFQNLITMSNQKQSLVKDVTNIKKVIFDLSLKDKAMDEKQSDSGTELKDVLLGLMASNRSKPEDNDEIESDDLDEALKELGKDI